MNTSTRLLDALDAGVKKHTDRNLSAEQLVNIIATIESAGFKIVDDKDGYSIGPATMTKVFEPNNIHDVHDMQAVFNCIEAALR